MPLITETLPNLINGVSQQAEALRLPSQSEVQDNAYSSVVEGLRKRPPTNHIAELISGTLGGAFTHAINRDTTERYIVIVTDGELQVFDTAGTEKTVAFPDGKGYLSSADPLGGFHAVTVDDYTFIANKDTTVAMDGTTSAARTNEAFYYVHTANAAIDYGVIIDGTTCLHNPSSANTRAVATGVKAAILASMPTPGDWTVTVETNGSVVHITRVDGAAFTFSGFDTFGDGYHTAVLDRVERFADLPSKANHGFTCEVAADADTDTDGYWVTFVADDVAADFSTGTWEETVAPATVTTFDAATMPHQLVRESDGTFTFQETAWGTRTAGDTETAPNPSFVGGTLNSVFFYENRLGFLSGQNVIMSRSGDYFEFFPETVVTVLDGSPIDYAAAHTKVAKLYHAIPFNQKLTLFSDQTQFVVPGGETLTQKTMRIEQTTEYENQTDVTPAVSGRSIFFPFRRGAFSGLREYFVHEKVDQAEVVEVTAHVPKYISGGITKISSSTIEDAVCVLASGDPTAIWVYKFYWNGQQKLQSSWSRFTFGTDASVLSADFIESTLYLTIQRDDGVYLETMELAPGVSDPDAEYLTHLDRRITEAECTSVTYDGGTDATTFTLPYTLGDGTFIIAGRTDDPQGDLLPGVVLTQTGTTSNTITVSGDHSADSVWIGQSYEMVYRFSPAIVRASQANGASVPFTSGHLQMRTWHLDLDNTGYITAEVTPRFGSTYTYTFTGRNIGSGNNIIGGVSLEDGRFSFPVMAKSNAVTVEIKNDSILPCFVTAAGWEAMFHSRSQRA